MSDNDDASAADPFGQIADEFVEAFRQGQRPSVEEVGRRYPQHADEIREVLPADGQNPLAGNSNCNDLILWLAYKEAKAIIYLVRII
jgi:hypothetical protein